MITDPLFYALAALGVMLTGISKSGFGSAAGGLAVPLMSLLIPAPQAAAIILPLLLVMDAAGVYIFWGKGDYKNLRIMIPGAFVGILIGMLAVGYIDARWINGLIGVEAVLFAIDRFRAAKREREAQPPSRPRGTFWGAVAGFTSFISHAGGPPVMQYLLPQKIDKQRLVGTTVAFFAVVNFTKLPAYDLLGLLDFSNLLTSLAILPAVPVGYWIGLKLLHRLNEQKFNSVLAWLLLFTGIKLIWDAVAF